jgi:hypothetical protein
VSYPTPFWFIELFKVLGFSLHVAPMNLWYAGAIIAAGFGILGKGNARIVGIHIARALPFAIAFGVNFGIIPLLFVQVAYYQFFYPATILMAWPWFSVFWLVTLAYFGIYLYRLSIEQKLSSKIGNMGGWIAAVLFIIVGFFFANALSLMTRVDGWWNIFKQANSSGAATGLALNTSDPTLVPRWLFMFGLAMTTTAVFVIVDTAFLSHRESGDYRRYARKFAFVLYTVGLLWFVGFGSWYIFGTRPDAFPMALKNPIMKIIFPLTMISPGLPWLLMLLQLRWSNYKLAVIAGLTQFGVIALNAVSRQWLQNVEVSRYTDLVARPVDLQTGALITFLLLFVGGLALVAWMISKIIEVNRAETKSGSLANTE